MRVLNYEAHNVMGIKDIRFDLDGWHLYLVGGKNGQGKTSAIFALLMALCGKSGFPEYPEISLKEGESRGWVRVNLAGADEDLHEFSGLTVELLLVRKRSGVVAEELRVLDSSGEEAPTPRTILKELYDLKAFDPLSFERLDKKGKLELLRKFLGLDFTAENKQHSEIYAKRTLVNKDHDRALASLDVMPYHHDAPSDWVVTNSLLEEFEEKQEQVAANAAKREALVKKQRECDENVKEIKKIQAAIKQLQADLDEEMRTGGVLCKERDEIKAEVDLLVDPDLEETREKIKNADVMNDKVRQNKAREEENRRVLLLEKQSDELSKKLEEIASKKREALQSAKWPVAGLSLDDEGVLLNGLPIEQANKATRVLTSAKIGMAMNPKLRLMVCTSGSDLDLDTIELLDKLLKESDFQMIVEFVTRTKSDEDLCAVVISNGEVKKSSVIEDKDVEVSV
jgi:hypothetical protein